MGAGPFVAMTKHLLATALRARGTGPDVERADVLDAEASAAALTWGVPRTVTTPTL
jgi:hypothetical protein